MQENKIYNTINCPILFYSNFSEDENVDLLGTVSIKRFENDIQYFIESGYKFYSLNELYDVINDDIFEEKALCLAFVDGFESEYTLAFEVLKRYGIHVDIFIDPKNIGVDSNNGLQRFTWSQTREMCESGLVNIQGFHNALSSDNSAELSREIINMIKLTLGNSNGISFLNSIGDTISINNIYELKQFGLKSQIIYYKQLCLDSVHKNCFGHMSMEKTMSVQEFEKIMLESKNELSNSIFLEMELSRQHNNLIEEFLKINDSVYLNILENPIFTNRPCIAFPLSVLGIDEYGNFVDFLATEFISIIALDSINYFGFDNFDYKTWPMLETHYIGSHIFFINNIDPLLFIYRALKNGYCVDVCTDAFYIPQKSYYKKEHISHNILIYGYDANSKVFKTLTHIYTGKYTHLDILAGDLMMSFATIYFKSLTLLRKNNWYRSYYSNYTIRQALCDYKNSIDLTCISKPYIDFFNTKIVGFKANEWLRNKIANEAIVNLSNIKAYIEHKKCMSWRIKYIATKTHIDISQHAPLIAQLDESDILLLLSVKYNITSDLSIKDRIIEKIDMINVAENTLIDFILQQL